MRSTRDGYKLMIGTQSCNMSIVSAIRLDTYEAPKVGPGSIFFDVCPQHTRIYLDHDSWVKAQNIESTESTRSLEPFHLANQARQLRSPVNILRRASIFLTSSHTCQPYTVFTYCNHEGATKTRNNGNSSMIVPRLFYRMLYGIIKKPSDVHAYTRSS